MTSIAITDSWMAKVEIKCVNESGGEMKRLRYGLSQARLLHRQIDY